MGCVLCNRRVSKSEIKQDVNVSCTSTARFRLGETSDHDEKVGPVCELPGTIIGIRSSIVPPPLTIVPDPLSILYSMHSTSLFGYAPPACHQCQHCPGSLDQSGLHERLDQSDSADTYPPAQKAAILCRRQSPSGHIRRHMLHFAFYCLPAVLFTIVLLARQRQANRDTGHERVDGEAARVVVCVSAGEGNAELTLDRSLQVGKRNDALLDMLSRLKFGNRLGSAFGQLDVDGDEMHVGTGHSGESAQLQHSGSARPDAYPGSLTSTGETSRTVTPSP